MAHEIHCKHCGRFLALTEKSIEIQLKCSSSQCKKLDTYKVTMLSDLKAIAILSIEDDERKSSLKNA